MTNVTQDQAHNIIDAHIQAENMDDSVKEWLVIDEDYEDGVEFTEDQIKSEVDSAWALELRARNIRRVISIVAHRHNLSDQAIRDLCRNIALNLDVWK